MHPRTRSCRVWTHLGVEEDDDTLLASNGADINVGARIVLERDLRELVAEGERGRGRGLGLLRRGLVLGRGGLLLRGRLRGRLLGGSRVLLRRRLLLRGGLVLGLLLGGRLVLLLLSRRGLVLGLLLLGCRLGPGHSLGDSLGLRLRRVSHVTSQDVSSKVVFCLLFGLFGFVPLGPRRGKRHAPNDALRGCRSWAWRLLDVDGEMYRRMDGWREDKRKQMADGMDE